MILIHQISNSDLEYCNDIKECLNHNLTNPIIRKIVIFSSCIDLEKKIGMDLKSKKLLLMKFDLSIFDIINYGKKNSKSFVIYGAPFIKFDVDLTNILNFDVKKVLKDDYSYYIFDRNLKIKNERDIDDVLVGEKIKIFLKTKKLGYYKNSDFQSISYSWRVSKNIQKPDTPKVDNPVIDTPKVDTSVIDKPVLDIPKYIPKKIIKKSIKNEYYTRKLDVIIVSVNYNDFLLISLENNSKIFENITVITSSNDFLCQKICEKFKVKCIVTDVMYEDGALFNKGKAINEGIRSIVDPDYILLLDADIVVIDKIDANSLEDDVFYTSDRYMVNNFDSYQNYISGAVNKDAFLLDDDKGYGFFQLFNYVQNIEYPENSNDASKDDIIFRDSFDLRKSIGKTMFHLGIDSNWKGRKSKSFLNYEQFNNLLEKEFVAMPKTFKICTFYYNPQKDVRREENFLRFLSQFEGYQDNMLIGLVDYDGDLKIPIHFKDNILVIKGDRENPIWYKETLINRMVDSIDTDYIIWMDNDLIYENLEWLKNINLVVGDKDFIQLYKTINYLGVDDEILSSYNSIMSLVDDIDISLRQKYIRRYENTNDFKPGGSWIGKTSILKEKRFFEKMYVGGGDTIFLYGLFGIDDGHTLNLVKENNEYIWKEAVEWIKSNKKYRLGYLDVSINHLYHGELRDRNYDGRYKLLKSVKNRGIMLIVFGFDYEKITPVIINSIRKFSKIPITIHTNIVDFTRLSDFENFENVRFIHYDMCDSDNRIIKTNLSEYSEFEETLYIDVDSVVLSDEFMELFDLLESFDIVFPLWRRFSSNKLFSLKENSKRYSDFYDVLTTNGLDVNDFVGGGVCAFKKSEVVSNFFVKYQKNWIFFGRKQDMPALNKTILESSIKYHILRENKYNLVNSTIIKSNHDIKENFYEGLNFIRKRYNPDSDKFDSVNCDSEIYFEKKSVCILYDKKGWAFYNKAHNIKKSLYEYYDISIIKYDEIKADEVFDVVISFTPTMVNKSIKNVIHGISSKKNMSLYKEISKYGIGHTNNKKSYEMLENKIKFLLYNGVNTEFFKYEKRSIVGNKVRIGALGSKNMMKYKGYYRISNVISKLSNICEDKMLFIDTDVPMSQSEIRKYYSEIDILIVSSVDENTPNPLLEAMSSGIPVITNNTGMAQELIDDGVNGFIIEDYSDIDSYVDKLNNLCMDRDLYERFSILGRKSVENYSWDKMSIEYRKMIDFYIENKDSL